jgi:hypothetical protein
MPVLAVQPVYLDIAHQHPLVLPGLALEAHSQLFTNEAAAAVGAHHVFGNQLFYPVRAAQGGCHAIALLLEAH